jgi:hypothetical protein
LNVIHESGLCSDRTDPNETDQETVEGARGSDAVRQ